MSIKNDIKASFAFVGTLIGAGFATGKEVKIYFGNSGVYVPIASGVIMGLLAFLFAEIGRRAKAESGLKLILPNTFDIWEVATSALNFFVYAAMLAAAEDVGKNYMGIHGMGLLVAMTSIACKMGGSEKIKGINSLLLPSISVLIFVVFIKAKPSPCGTFSVSPTPALLYACMNALTSSKVMMDISKSSTKKDNALISIISGTSVTALLLPVYLIVKAKGQDAELPLLEAFVDAGMGFWGGIVALFAITTTSVGAIGSIEIKSSRSGVLFGVGGLGVAVLGFENIVETVYPVCGIIGCGVVIFAVIFIVKNATHIDKNRRFCLEKKGKRWYNGL